MDWFQVDIGIPVIGTVGCCYGAFSKLVIGPRRSRFHVGIPLCCWPLSHTHRRTLQYGFLAIGVWLSLRKKKNEGAGKNFFNYLILASVLV